MVRRKRFIIAPSMALDHLTADAPAIIHVPDKKEPDTTAMASMATLCSIPTDIQAGPKVMLL